MEAILASTLNRYYCFAHPDSILWIFWYVREASTAIIVTNVPHCYALPRRILKLGSFGSMLRSKRARRDKHGAASDEPQPAANKSPTEHVLTNGKSGTSDSTENLAADQSSKPNPAGSTLQIWHRSEYGVDADDTNEPHPEHCTELEIIWAGRMGTTATVEVEKTESQPRGQHPDDGIASRK
ncbi:hypothetical protein E4U41_004278 [Claviceps citrina]|nr:hypothetical protein E4U41_004278 [Claviceps citrina]